MKKSQKIHCEHWRSLVAQTRADSSLGPTIKMNWLMGRNKTIWSAQKCENWEKKIDDVWTWWSSLWMLEKGKVQTKRCKITLPSFEIEFVFQRFNENELFLHLNRLILISSAMQEQHEFCEGMLEINDFHVESKTLEISCEVFHKNLC